MIGLVALGLVAAFSAALMMAALGKPLTSGAQNSDDREVTVLIAKHDIPSVSRLSSDDLTERTMKASEAPADVITDTVHVIGKTVARPLLKGEPITRQALIGNTRGAEMVSDLPPGMRAVTVELRHAAGLEGLLYPGSVVDVLATFRFDQDLKDVGEAISTTLLNNVKVLAIDDTTRTLEDEEQASKSDTQGIARSKSRRVTLLVDSRQAEALQLATVHGTVSLAMRNPNDQTASDRDATLLAGGQLASLAEYLSTQVSQSQPDAERAPSLFETRNPTRPRLHDWDVTVMRGDDIEVQVFEAERGAVDAEVLR